MEGKLSQITSTIKKCEAERQDPGLSNFNKLQKSFKRWKDMNEGIETHKEPQIERLGDDGLETADENLNDESATQRNDLGFGSAQEALGDQQTEGDIMNEGNADASPTAHPPQTEVSQNQKETTAPINDTYSPDRSLLLSFKFHRARSIYLGQEPDCLRVHHHARTWHLDKEPTIVQDLLCLQMELSREPPNVGEHEQYLMLRDENKALMEQISALNEEI
ncbi:hypothetical protein GIB67_033900 [Kingdonia uniflora]|uniref:Uncharacterized protein n=1 Tax=Kingdonia uniflora TaxID=39325 RepID=A0A7J7NCA7_9MAGN|nr:hypothetical protein GIB67_033900 [Kingdonia uniflora]